MHWLDQYGSEYHQWHKATYNGNTIYYRPLGLVEYAFDTDGTDYEGRADMNGLLTLQVASDLNRAQIHHHILLAWTALCQQHALIRSKVLRRQPYMAPDAVSDVDRFFVVEQPHDERAALAEAAKTVVFLDDSYTAMDPFDFYRHSQNTGRVIEPSAALSKCFVLPFDIRGQGTFTISLLMIHAHQIVDGLSLHAWYAHLWSLLNTSGETLRRGLSSLLTPQAVEKRLPPAQEDLYPPILGSTAKKRWFWVITVILRHVRKPLRAAFQNPLRREEPLLSSVAFEPKYMNVLDYDTKPPLNSYTCRTRIGLRSTQRLHRLCREAKVSIGAGCFVLVAITMMEAYEERFPNVPDDKRRPFIGSFPINPRPFFKHTEPPDSLMLAFSDGLVLPWLSSSLNLDARFRLLVQQAQRQLAIYQKRTRVEDENLAQYMGSRGAGRIVANSYIMAAERAESKRPEHLKKGINPQGAYPVRANPTMATCGVSSVGRRQVLKRKTYTANEVRSTTEDAKDFVADFEDMDMNVRVRDGEFLVGIGGNSESIFVNVSYDGNSMDEELVRRWQKRIETLLDGADIEKAKL
ncbi:hypothetical protein LTR50_004190 [Elasticomyces elasticus]|nr:hypothetical protein LTR50_004190 [Elasticomyces elasticus]